jgi:hypothetical protein
MELSDLQTIKARLETILAEKFPSSDRRVSIEFPDSPNPLCFFEVTGTAIVQGSFWSNNEYRMQTIAASGGTEMLTSEGMVITSAEAIGKVEKFCSAIVGRN